MSFEVFRVCTRNVAEVTLKVVAISNRSRVQGVQYVFVLMDWVGWWLRRLERRVQISICFGEIQFAETDKYRFHDLRNTGFMFREIHLQASAPLPGFLEQQPSSHHRNPPPTR